MKKHGPRVLVITACVFAAFLLGFFAGRSINRTPVQIRSLPAPTESMPAPEETRPASSGIVNVNTATAEELQTLPGIGPVLAGRIIDYREQTGGFQTVGELANVSGIGEKRLEEIWDHVTTGG